MLRSGELCGFYKSSNGESYQNELTGVRNSFLTPVFEALKVRDPRLEPISHYSFYEDIRNDSKERNLYKDTNPLYFIRIRIILLKPPSHKSKPSVLYL